MRGRDVTQRRPAPRTLRAAAVVAALALQACGGSSPSAAPTAAPPTATPGTATPGTPTAAPATAAPPVITPPPVVTAPPGPTTCAVAYWPADGTADDPVGAMNGTLEGGAAFAAGKFGQAFSFDGTDDLVRVPSAPLLNPTGSFSLQAWINPTGVAGPVLQKWGDEGDLAGQRAYSMWYGGPSGGVGFSISDDAHQGDGVFHGLGTDAGAAPAGTWTHVTNVYDQSTGTRTIYVNGVSKATRTDPPTTITNSIAPLAFGAHIRSSTGFGQWFGGLLDDVRYFDVALSPAQVAAAAAAGTAGVCI